MASAGNRPLAFGDLQAVPTDETALEHVLQGRADRLQAGPGPNRTALGNIPIEAPPELSVDRHADLSHVGATLLEKHLQTILQMTGGLDSMDDELDDAAEEIMSAASSECMSPTSTQDSFGMSPWADDSPGSPGGKKALVSFAGSSEEAQPESPGGASSPGDLSKKQVLLAKAKMMGKINLMRSKSASRREEEAKMKRQRHEQLKTYCENESMPNSYTAKEMNTAWVSPKVMELASGHNHDAKLILAKSRAETHHIRMTVHPPTARALNLSMSAPSLSSTRRSNRGTQSGKMAEGSPMTQGSFKEDGSATGSSSKPQTSPTALGSSGAFGSSLRGGSLPSLSGNVAIRMDGPHSLPTKVIVNRLEGEAKAFRAQSFAVYLKEADVFTGVKKERLDAQLLRDQEEAAMKQMHYLVGGSPRRVLYPSGLKSKRKPHRRS
eukprot:TRINITY_DN94493_c0_g1_i1.p1 TRINITY_DN94493_c0_g1~~TRINITY_DN94493_c0_g1_i1.p1  ORF type:complete len:459 (-),score=76.18 TRINITY_DN94493_c0_g1_i1:26-1336(-)